MNIPVRDLSRRPDFKESGKKRYYALREVGYSREAAARTASISHDYAINLDNMSAEAPGVVTPQNDDSYVAALVAAGGFSRLSEKLLRSGHVVCLPLMPYEARQ